MKNRHQFLALLFLLFFSSTSALAQTPARVVAMEGQSISGSIISTLNSPFTDGNGLVGFTGTTDTGNFVWYDGGAVWFNSDETVETLTGGEATMGVSNSGNFVYSPSISGSDGLWTSEGELVREDVQAPTFPVGTNSTFHSRPTMSPDGTSFWVSGINASGGTSTESRVIYKSTPGPAPAPPSFEVIVKAGDVIDGVTVNTGSSVSFDYDFSDNTSHYLIEIDAEGATSTDDAVLVVDGTIVAREASPANPPATGNWDNFDNPSINDSGNHIFSGDTDGNTSSDEFLAYNGIIQIKEGDNIDGLILGSSVNAASLNNAGFVSFIWTLADGSEALFYGRATDLMNSVKVLQTGEAVDDPALLSLATATVTDFNASNSIAPGVDLAGNGKVLVEVDLDFGAGPIEAIIELDTSSLLPVELTHFEAKASENSVLLNWQTASETNNAGFEIQMLPSINNSESSVANSDWKVVDWVQGAGSTSQTQSYDFEIADLDPNTYNFRLKQIDFDGSFSFSPIVLAQVSLPSGAILSQAYPNPFSDLSRFTLAVAETQNVELILFDLAGREVKVIFSGNLPANQTETFIIDAGALPSGVYFYKAIGTNFTKTQKILLSR